MDTVTVKIVTNEDSNKTRVIIELPTDRMAEYFGQNQSEMMAMVTSGFLPLNEVSRIVNMICDRIYHGG